MHNFLATRKISMRQKKPGGLRIYGSLREVWHDDCGSFYQPNMSYLSCQKKEQGSYTERMPGGDRHIQREDSHLTEAETGGRQLQARCNDCWQPQKLGERYGTYFPSEPPRRTLPLILQLTELLEFGILAFRSVKEYISFVCSHQFMVICLQQPKETNTVASGPGDSSPVQ